MSTKVDERPGDDATLEDFEFYWELHELEVTYGIHERNYRELQLVLNEFVDVEKARALLRPEKRTDFNEIMREVVRRLHNFVASANTLVDHTRNHVRKLYNGTPFEAECKAETNRRFVGNELRGFIQDLRNYSLHVQSPDVWASLAADSTKVRASFVLSIRDLLEWKKWSAQSRRYLKGLGDKVDISLIVESYMRMVEEFYSWLRSREYEIHAPLINRVKSNLRGSPKPT